MNQCQISKYNVKKKCNVTQSDWMMVIIINKKLNKNQIDDKIHRKTCFFPDFLLNFPRKRPIFFFQKSFSCNKLLKIVKKKAVPCNKKIIRKKKMHWKNFHPFYIHNYETSQPHVSHVERIRISCIYSGGKTWFPMIFYFS